MVRRCCMEGCEKEWHPGCQLSFHMIPKNEDQKNQWLAVIKKKVGKNAMVCSAHFNKEDYDDNVTRPRLKATAVPSVFHKKLQMNYVLPEMVPKTTSKNFSNMATPSSQGDTIESNLAETDISKVCRVCLGDSETEPVLNNLACSFIGITGIQTYQNTLKDRMSISLCVSCWDDFYKCLEFRENAQRANASLVDLKKDDKLTIENIRHIALNGNSTDIEFVAKTETDTLLCSDDAQEGGVKTELMIYEDDGNNGAFTDQRLVETEHLKVENTANNELENMYYTNSDEYSESDQCTMQDDQPLEKTQTNNKTRKQTNTKVYNTNNDQYLPENEQETSSDDEPLLKKLPKTSKHTNKNPVKTTLTGKKKKDVNIDINKKQTNKTKDKTNEKGSKDLSEHFALSVLNETEQRNEFEKRKLDQFYLGRKYKCLLCYRGYLSQETFDRHVEQQHTELPDRRFKCHICSTYFRKKTYLNQHLMLHSEQYKCKQCDFVTEKRSSAELHIYWHQGKMYECKHCFKTFKRRSTLYNHHRIDHAADCVCYECGFSFASDWGLKLHLKRIHRSDSGSKAPESGPKCEECNITFVSDGALDTHRKVSPKHNDKNNRLRNDASAKNTREPQLRKNPSQGSTKPRTDVIDPNNALQRRKGTMRNQNVKCEKCGELQPTFFAYRKHFNSAHPGEIRTQFPRLSKQLLCDHCGKVFRSKAYLRDHMNGHNKLAIRCTDCSKSFYSRLAYSLHRHTHLGVKYPCKLCGKTFTRQSNRERHAVTVHNVRSIKCNFCDKYFKSEEVQKIHTEHVHYNKPWPKRVRNKDGHRAVVRSESD